jgi:hypothetical protein
MKTIVLERHHKPGTRSRGLYSHLPPQNNIHIFCDILREILEVLVKLSFPSIVVIIGKELRELQAVVFCGNQVTAIVL